MFELKRYPFTSWAISGAPEDLGVYVLWKGGEIVYIGSATGPEGIKAALREQFAKESEGSKIATEYGWEISRNPRARELELLAEHRRRFQRLPRLNAGPGG